MRAWCALLIACGTPPLIATHVEDWRDQVIYEVVVDRFDDADESNDTIDGIGPDPLDLSRFQGGDWRGVEQHLDYIARLGATAIWISPPYRNIERTEDEDGYHGYWPADFLDHNPRFGSLEDLRSLVRAAHARNMLVILDVVPNHAGRVFNYDLDRDGVVDPEEIEPPFSRDAPYDAPLIWVEHPRLTDGDQPFSLEERHFHRRGRADLADDAQKELGDFPTGLRDLNSEDQDVVRGLIDAHARWVELTDIDGMRLDAVPHAPREFWAQFCAGLRERLDMMGKHHFLLLGEVFSADPAVLSSYAQIGALDSAFAFDLKWSLIDGVLLGGGAPAFGIAALSANRSFFPGSGQPNGIDLSPWQARVGFADNHDTGRIRGELDDPLALEITMVVLFTVDAIPAIYYGTEQELMGVGHHLAREPLWRTAGFDETAPMYRFIQRLAQLRRDSPALRHGDLIVRYASEHGGLESESDASILAYERSLGDERFLIVINAHALQTSRAHIPTAFPEGARLMDALGQTTRPWIVSGAAIDVALPPRSAIIVRDR